MNIELLRYAQACPSFDLRRGTLAGYLLGIALVFFSGAKSPATASDAFPQEDKLKDSQFIAEGSRLFGDRKSVV